MASLITSRRQFLALAGAASLARFPFVRGGESLPGFVAHEWGTFTTLQDEQGLELVGINIDDEPLPPFVHNLNPYLLSNPFLSSLHWRYRQKAAPRHHPLVTMRLETPVIYFYPPPGQAGPMTLDVNVRFQGGWLTEFYPDAVPSAPGLEEGTFEFGELTPGTIGSLAWSGLSVGDQVAGPETDQNVWLAPRQVASVGVTTQQGESENYLFYRGIGCQKAPLSVTLDREAGRMAIRPRLAHLLASDASVPFGQFWLLHVLPDGQCAFRVLEGREAGADEQEVLHEAPFRFARGDYSSHNRQRLHEAMHKALVADGLFADEAVALLSTWQRAYFTSPGLRLFYLVPRVWTDACLPIEIRPEPDLVRTMVGRIELVSDEQRKILAELADMPISDGQWVYHIPESPAAERFFAGRADFGDLGVEIPREYRLYLNLGRFRNALVTAEEARTGSASLTAFVDAYALHPFRVSPPATANAE